MHKTQKYFTNFPLSWSFFPPRLLEMIFSVTIFFKNKILFYHHIHTLHTHITHEIYRMVSSELLLCSFFYRILFLILNEMLGLLVGYSINTINRRSWKEKSFNLFKWMASFLCWGFFFIIFYIKFVQIFSLLCFFGHNQKFIFIFVFFYFVLSCIIFFLCASFSVSLWFLFFVLRTTTWVLWDTIKFE